MDANVIPPITEPMGKHWRQPAVEEILLDDTHAVMTEKTLEQLGEYSTSKPSGVYPGKMWRARQRGKWWLCWYGFGETADFCSNNYREILIA